MVSARVGGGPGYALENPWPKGETPPGPVPGPPRLVHHPPPLCSVAHRKIQGHQMDVTSSTWTLVLCVGRKLDIVPTYTVSSGYIQYPRLVFFEPAQGVGDQLAVIIRS